jgi:chloramphenicol 3-O phosphotransferase
MTASSPSRSRLPDVIVLNGASSSGKSTLAAALQDRLDEPFLHVGVDTFSEALPHGLDIDVTAAGDVTVSDTFRELEQAWLTGLAAMATAGARLIIDEVFLGGRNSQRRLEAKLAVLRTIWVGVHCRLDIAEARERLRGDRVAGMAASQSDRVHRDVHYDLEVDTSALSPSVCAEMIVDALTDP